MRSQASPQRPAPAGMASSADRVFHFLDEQAQSSASDRVFASRSPEAFFLGVTVGLPPSLTPGVLSKILIQLGFAGAADMQFFKDPIPSQNLQTELFAKFIPSPENKKPILKNRVLVEGGALTLYCAVPASEEALSKFISSDGGLCYSLLIDLFEDRMAAVEQVRGRFSAAAQAIFY